MKDEEKDESVIYVSPEDWDLIQDLIKNPRQPTPALIDLMEKISFKEDVKRPKDKRKRKLEHLK